jgi:hypothetical protein
MRVATAAAVVYAIVVVCGLWRYWVAPAPDRTFLTLWLGGDLMGGFQALGFNVAYFAQYACAYIPLIALVLIEPGRRWAVWVAGFGLLVSPYAMVTTAERTGQCLFLLELIALLAGAVVWRKRQGRTGGRGLVIGVGALVLLTIAFAVLTPAGSRTIEKMRHLWRLGDPYRSSVLAVAWRMLFQQPFLGIGSGGFAHEFPRYDPNPAMRAGSLTAHNIYLQFLVYRSPGGVPARHLRVAQEHRQKAGDTRRTGRRHHRRAALWLEPSISIFICTPSCSTGSTPDPEKSGRQSRASWPGRDRRRLQPLVRRGSPGRRC